jgi:glycosyltransferase involved in cell wall biosynthesis
VSAAAPPLHVALVADALEVGGAEAFVLRLGAALVEAGHAATVFALRGDRVDAAFVESLRGRCAVVPLRLRGLRITQRLDGLLFRLGLPFSLLRWRQARWLAAALRGRGATVVHSHLVTADLVALRAAPAAGLPWLSTMHGDYLALEAAGGRDRAPRIHDFGRALARIEAGVSALVCITEAQEAQLRRLLPGLARRGALRRIYNGYAPPAPDPGAVAAAAALPADAFVVGMVSRGVRAKGWAVLLEAFDRLRLPGAWLVLVGEGEELQRLRAANANPRVLFAGAARDPMAWIARFDVACLPTRFATESLPTVVIEYLHAGKPVVATGVGEIPAMLRTGSAAPAGLLLALAGEAAMAGQLASALRLLHDQPARRARLGEAARAAFAPFSMARCLQAYLPLYRGAPA